MADYEVDIEVRFRDIDAMGHVNNAVYATYLEQARARFVRDVLDEPLLETGAVVADLHIDFERPIEFGETVTVAVEVGDLGATSIPLSYDIRAGGERAATAETRVVTYDRETDQPRPIPDDWREHLEEFQ